MAVDRSLQSVEKLTGLALVFMGFINNFLSIQGDYKLDQFNTVTFLFGVVLFVHASVQNWYKWAIMGMAVALGALFFVHGEVGTWYQIGMFYGTLFVVIFYIFFAREPKVR